MYDIYMGVSHPGFPGMAEIQNIVQDYKIPTKNVKILVIQSLYCT